MDPEDWHVLVCPNACPDEDIAAVLLPGRQLFLLCYCKDCCTAWLEGPQGVAQFTRDQLRELQELRKRYLTGELTG